VPESLLAILKLCALALVYLFFLRVLRAVWAEVAPVRASAGPGAATTKARPSRRAAPRGAKAGGDALVVIEPKEHKGARYAIADEVTMGRAAGCTVTLDDTYASQLHARVFQRDGVLHVEDLGSTNGTYLNGQKLTGVSPLDRGDHVKVGATVFEVR
jgi:pSer/pThr/pTyr-binding forkhead associated (FHA) protein